MMPPLYTARIKGRIYHTSDIGRGVWIGPKQIVGTSDTGRFRSQKSFAAWVRKHVDVEAYADE